MNNKPVKDKESYMSIEYHYRVFELTKNSIYTLFIGIVYYRSGARSKRKYCSAKNEWIRDHLGISMRSVNNMIDALKNLDLINISKGTYLGKVERKITLTDKCLQLLNKKTNDKMENLDESIFSDKPVEQKPLKGKSLIIPGDSILEKDEVEFNKLRASYFQPMVFGKKKELKAYKELTEEERALAFNNLKQYLELTDETYVMSFQNYLLNKKFSNQNIEYLKKRKNISKCQNKSDDNPIKENHWNEFE